TKGVLRGLHFQNGHAQGKLVQVCQGEVFDVAVDLRKSSKTFGKWFGIVLSQANKLQVYVPPGFAHGFQVLSDTAVFSYKCTDYYHPEAEHTLLWNDLTLAIDWPVKSGAQVSPKDGKGMTWAELSQSEFCFP